MKFRKKPVVIEARQLGRDYDEDVAIMRWCGGAAHMNGDEGPLFLISTLEGNLKAMPDDWIIQGVKGEFYPCKPDIFAADLRSGRTVMRTSLGWSQRWQTL